MQEQRIDVEKEEEVAATKVKRAKSLSKADMQSLTKKFDQEQDYD